MSTIDKASHYRDFVDAVGPDTVKFLHAIVSQDIAGMVDGDVQWSFLLTPQGRVVSHFRVHRIAEDHLILDIEAGFGAGLESALRRYLIRTKCVLTLISDQFAVWSRVQPEKSESSDIRVVSAHPLLGGVDMFGHDESRAVSVSAPYEEARIGAGVPAMGKELNESSIPNGTGLLQWAVNFKKGCYLGQELVERIDSRSGNTPARLVRLVFSNPPMVDVESVERPALTVTSTSPHDDVWVGLGWASRTVAVGDTVNGALVVSEVGAA
jgi:tRNA-modifying protein YgfZ